MNLNKIFGNNLKQFRYKKNYTQEKLAELVDISVTYISQLELGYHTPSFDKIEILADILEIEPSELFKNREFKNLPPRIDIKKIDENKVINIKEQSLSYSCE